MLSYDRKDDEFRFVRMGFDFCRSAMLVLSVFTHAALTTGETAGFWIALVLLLLASIGALCCALSQAPATPGGTGPGPR